MSARDADTIQPEHVERWLAVTRQYLFSDDSIPCAGDAQPPGPCHRQRRRWVDIATLLDELDRPQRAGSLSPACREGGTLRLLSWAHRATLATLRHASRMDDTPLRVLRRTFYLQASLLAKYPTLAAHLVPLLSSNADPDLRRRVRSVVGHYQTKLERLIRRARRRGDIAATVDDRGAARLFITLLHALAARARDRACEPRELRARALRLIGVYLRALGAVDSHGPRGGSAGPAAIAEVPGACEPAPPPPRPRILYLVSSTDTPRSARAAPPSDEASRGPARA